MAWPAWPGLYLGAWIEWSVFEVTNPPITNYQTTGRKGWVSTTFEQRLLNSSCNAFCMSHNSTATDSSHQSHNVDWRISCTNRMHQEMHGRHGDVCGGRYISGGTLTHWGRVTHICVSKLSIIGSDNGLSADRRQAIIWTNAGILLIGTLGTNFSEILFEIHTFSLKNIYLKMSSGKWHSFCLGLNVLSNTTGLR